LAAQAPFNLGHSLSWKAPVLEGLLQGRGGLLRLVAVTGEALLGFGAVALSGFRVFFEVSCGGGPGALLASVWLCGGDSLSKRT
jgi:hypothetical protein